MKLPHTNLSCQPRKGRLEQENCVPLEGLNSWTRLVWTRLVLEHKSLSVLNITLEIPHLTRYYDWICGIYFQWIQRRDGQCGRAAIKRLAWVEPCRCGKEVYYQTPQTINMIPLFRSCPFINSITCLAWFESKEGG
jgi:hypothetical protein